MVWKKGLSGNEAGRPEGAKDRLTTKFWTDFLNEWELGGPDALTSIRKNDPGAFVRVAASLMPKETKVTLRNELDSMNEPQLREFIRRELAFSGDGGAEPEELTVKGITH